MQTWRITEPKAGSCTASPWVEPSLCCCIGRIQHSGTEQFLSHQCARSVLRAYSTRLNPHGSELAAWLLKCGLFAWLQISEKVKPHPFVVTLLTKVEEIIPKWKIVPTKDIIDSTFKDPIKREKVTELLGSIPMVFTWSFVIWRKYEFLSPTVCGNYTRSNSKHIENPNILI